MMKILAFLFAGRASPYSGAFSVNRYIDEIKKRTTTIGAQKVIGATDYALRFHPSDLEWLDGLTEEIRTYMLRALNEGLTGYDVGERGLCLTIEASLSAKPGAPQIEVIDEPG